MTYLLVKVTDTALVELEDLIGVMKSSFESQINILQDITN